MSLKPAFSKQKSFATKQIAILVIIFGFVTFGIAWNLSSAQASPNEQQNKKSSQQTENQLPPNPPKKEKKAKAKHKQNQALPATQAQTQQSNPAVNTPGLDFKGTINKIYKGEAVTLNWSSQNASSCTGSGTYQGDVLVGSAGARQKWNGPQSLAGSVRTMPLDGSHTFMLNCTGTSGQQSKSLNLTIDEVKPIDKPIGVFDQGCPYSHSLPDDPIVFPNQPGKSHLHDFFGFKHTNAFSNFDNMRSTVTSSSTPTTCTEFGKSKGSPPAPNASAYWVPALYLNGQKVNPANAHVYYKGGPHRKAAAFPPGFKMIAGNAHASLEEAKKADVIRWWCGGLNQSRVGEVPADCKGKNSINVEVGFPACWNGQLNSANHQSHVAYARDGCSKTHPLKLPRIVLNIRYEIFNQTGKRLHPTTDKITLASGGMWTMHADYLFAWDQSRLDFLTHECLNKKINTSGDKTHQKDCKRNPPQN